MVFCVPGGAAASAAGETEARDAEGQCGGVSGRVSVHVGALAGGLFMRAEAGGAVGPEAAGEEGIPGDRGSPQVTVGPKTDRSKEAPLYPRGPRDPRAPPSDRGTPPR